MTPEQRIAQLEKQLAEATANAVKPRSISFKVTAKKPDGSGTDGAISAYGLGRFPVTLYRGQWERLIEAVPQLEAFVQANAALLSVKS